MSKKVKEQGTHEHCESDDKEITCCGGEGLTYLLLRQTGSPNRAPAKYRATLIGLGLNKIGRMSVLPNNPCTWGMIQQVAHLIEVLADLPGDVGEDFESQEEVVNP